MNIVRINEAIFEAFQTSLQCGFCWSYTYARTDYANLKDDKDKCCVHVFMEDFTTERIRGNDGLVDYTRHVFTLKILLDSLFDIQVFNELEPEESKSKFTEYVEPLLDCFPDAYNSEICNQGLSIEREKIVAKYNRKDQNKDGIVIQYTVRDDS